MPCDRSGSCRAAAGLSTHRPPDFSTCTMPPMTRRSLTRSLPRVSVGKNGATFASRASLSQNRSDVMDGLPSRPSITPRRRRQSGGLCEVAGAHLPRFGRNETAGLLRLIFSAGVVSGVRMVSLTPFETKRNLSAHRQVCRILRWDSGGGRASASQLSHRRAAQAGDAGAQPNEGINFRRV